MRIKKLLHTFLFLICTSGCFAANLMGAEITYKFIGKDSVWVTVTTYKSCRNYAVDSIYLYTKGVGFNYIDTQVVYASFCKNVTPVCKGQCTSCDTVSCNNNGYPAGSNSGCKFYYGIEKVVFEALVVLPKDTNGKMCNFRIFIREGYRDGSITNLSGGDYLYNYTLIDRCKAPNNHSPVFGCDPMLMAYTGNCYQMCFNAFDEDGDSISYQLQPALAAEATSAAYSYSSQTPINFLGFPKILPYPGKNCSGFLPDSINGFINFMPTKQENAVLVFVAKEWRRINGKMTQIGIVRRDQTLIVRANPPSRPPVLSGIIELRACAGDSVWYKQRSTDPDTSDSVHVTYKGNLPGAIFISYLDSGRKAESWQLGWKTTEADISTTPYNFMVEATDDHCPVVQKTCRLFHVLVTECPTDQRQYTDLGCGRIRVTATPDSAYQNGKLGYSWYYNGKPYYARDTIIQVDRGNLAYIYHEFTHNQFYNTFWDAVTYKDFLRLGIQPGKIKCLGDSQQVFAQVTNDSGRVQYRWNSASFSASDSFSYIAANNFLLNVLAQDSFGCVDSASIVLQPKPLPQVDLGTDTTLCAHETVILQNKLNQNSYSNRWSMGDTSLSIYTDSSDIYIVFVTDSNGCVDGDTIYVFKRSPLDASFTVQMNQYQVSCKPTQLGFQNYHWDFGDSTGSDSINPSHAYARPGSYRILLTVSDSFSCSDQDSFWVTIYNGISVPAGIDRVALFPNPANDQLRVTWQITVPSSVYIRIYDAQGRMIQEIDCGSSGGGIQTRDIDVANLADGAYRLQLYGNGGQSASRTFTIIRNK